MMANSSPAQVTSVKLVQLNETDYKGTVEIKIGATSTTTIPVTLKYDGKTFVLKTSQETTSAYPKDLREFNRRAEAGEFAKEHKAPKRKKAEPDGESSLNE